MLGGEVHNSSASSAVAIRRSFARVREIGADTVLAPITWQQFETEEGRFDFELIDVALATAREFGLRWIPLWFGAWKNGMSSYAPGWVKRDLTRFPRSSLAEGVIEHISPFGPNIASADAAAFSAFMAHLRAAGAEDVVPTVQVENEPGILGGPRDRSHLAEIAWSQNVPADVVGAVAAQSGALQDHWRSAGARREGSWEEIFGDKAAEAFMAAAFARHVQQVIAAGRAEFNVPCFVNAWLDADPAEGLSSSVAGGVAPGAYPSGGPLPTVLPIWRLLAPDIDVYAPDFYFGNFERVCQEYTKGGNPLFIPELRRDPFGIGLIYRAIGQYNAACVAPFGLDSLEVGAEGWDDYIDAYQQIRAVLPLVEDAPAAHSHGFALTAEHPYENLVVGRTRIRVDMRDETGLLEEGEAAYGIIVELTDNSFLTVGRGFVLTIEPAAAGTVTGFVEVAELDSDLATVRVLNGDELGGGGLVRFHRRYSGRGQGLVPFDTRSTGIARISTYSIT